MTTMYVLIWRQWDRAEADDYDNVIGVYVDADRARAVAQEVAVQDANAEQEDTGVLINIKPLQWHQDTSTSWTSDAEHATDDGFFEVLGMEVK